MPIVNFPSDANLVDVIMKLWEKAQFVGIGILQDDGHGISRKVAEDASKKEIIDYLKGKPLKLDLKDYPVLESRLYDRDAGSGTMQSVADLFHSKKRARQPEEVTETASKKAKTEEQIILRLDVSGTKEWDTYTLGNIRSAFESEIKSLFPSAKIEPWLGDWEYTFSAPDYIMPFSFPPSDFDVKFASSIENCHLFFVRPDLKKFASKWIKIRFIWNPDSVFDDDVVNNAIATCDFDKTFNGGGGGKSLSQTNDVLKGTYFSETLRNFQFSESSGRSGPGSGHEVTWGPILEQEANGWFDKLQYDLVDQFEIISRPVDQSGSFPVRVYEIRPILDFYVNSDKENGDRPETPDMDQRATEMDAALREHPAMVAAVAREGWH